jgi:hypothetical protein
MKKKFLTIGLPVLGGLLIAGVGIASAAGMFAGAGGPGPGGLSGPGGFGGGLTAVSPTDAATSQTAQFQAEASALGINESLIVSGWAEGESLQQIATANGISATQLQADMKTYEASQQNDELQALVTAGTITQAQMTQRLAATTAQEAAAAAAQTAMAVKTANASGTWAGGHGGFGGMRRGGHATSTTSTSGSTP